MKRSILPVLFLSILFLGIQSKITQGQEDDDACPLLVQRAYRSVQTACEGLGRNEACYGNTLIDAEPQAEVETFEFSAPGDLVDISDIETLQLSSMDTTTDRWGISKLSVQANLPDSIPQGIELLLFGNVSLSNDGAASDELRATVTLTGRVTVRVYASMSALDTLVAEFPVGTTLTADWRDAGSRWVHVVFDLDGQTQQGWATTGLFEEADLSVLPVAGANTEGPFAPMQAFYFTSGVDDRPCASAPDSGILIQTPEGVGEITLLVNEVAIDLGSTVYTQAEAGGEMLLNVIEGQARVHGGGRVVTVPEGTRVRIPLDANGLVAGDPSWPEAYDDTALGALPVVLLPDVVAVAPSPVAEALTAEILESNPCTVQVAGGVDYYSGPGTEYPVIGQAGGDRVLEALGQAADDSNATWWRLNGGNWLPASTVSAQGYCEGVAVVEAPVAPSEPLAASGGQIAGEGVPFNIHGCNGGIWHVGSGADVMIEISHGRFQSADEAMTYNGGATMTINGSSYSEVEFSTFEAPDEGPTHLNAMFHIGVLPDGTYSVSATITSTREGHGTGSNTCTLIVG